MRILYTLLIIVFFSCGNDTPKTNKENNTAEKPSELKFNKKFIDFGEVSSDTVLTATYVVYNTSQNPLIIKYVNPDCSCTSYSVTKYRIAHGDSAIIEMKVDTHHKSGENKVYAVVCANTETRFYKLTMKMNVK